MKTNAPQATPNETPAEDRYFQGDPIPVAEVIEADTDQVWALWNLVNEVMAWRAEAAPAA